MGQQEHYSVLEIRENTSETGFTLDTQHDAASDSSCPLGFKLRCSGVIKLKTIPPANGDMVSNCRYDHDIKNCESRLSWV